MASKHPGIFGMARWSQCPGRYEATPRPLPTWPTCAARSHNRERGVNSVSVTRFHDAKRDHLVIDDFDFERLVLPPRALQPIKKRFAVRISRDRFRLAQRPHNLKLGHSQRDFVCFACLQSTFLIVDSVG